MSRKLNNLKSIKDTFPFLQLNLAAYNFSKSYEIPLESLPFGIVSHSSYVPLLLTRVIINDIRRFSEV